MSLRSTQVVLVGLLAGLMATAASAGDLTGIWQIDKPITAIKTTTGQTPPLQPAAAALYAKRQAMLKKGDKSFDPTQRCKPIGEPRILYEGQPFEIVQTPKLLVFNYTWNRLDRLVYLDDDAGIHLPTYSGSTAATRDGDTIVLTVTEFQDITLLDASGMPHSENMKLVERFHTAPDNKTLIADIHVEDPATFTKPWDMTLRFNRTDRVRLDEDVCVERMHLFP